MRVREIWKPLILTGLLIVIWGSVCVFFIVQKSNAQESQSQIVNRAQVTFEDSQGNQYGPVYSNQVITTIIQRTLEISESAGGLSEQETETVQKTNYTKQLVQQLKLKIEEIRAKIAYLQNKLNSLLSQDTLLTRELTEIIPADFRFIQHLGLGSKGSDVRYLQIFLNNQGRAIYPESLITGYFGPLTKAALSRFQEKYAQEILAPWQISHGTGFMGATTRFKINQLLKQ